MPGKQGILMRGIYSGDSERAFRAARGTDSGVVLVNNYFRGVLGAPFGGARHSGYGREHYIDTLKEFCSVKMIRFPSGVGATPAWRRVRDIFGDTGSAA